MKIAKVFLFLLMVSRVFGAGITFTFENGQVTGTSPKYYEFDVYVAATEEGTKIGSCGAYVNYNETAFGLSVVDNGKMTATRGTLVSNGAVYDLKINDNSPIIPRAAITIDYTSGDPSYGADLGTVPQQWAHVKIEIKETSASSDLSFEQSLMLVGSCKQSDNTYYDPVTATDRDDSSLPVQFAGISATVAEGKGIILTWHTESEVGSAGFNVWRSDIREGSYVKLTTQLIPSQGNSSSRQEYTFTDQNVVFGGEYWYKVEELSQNGASTFYGPIRALGMSGIPDVFALSDNYPNPFNPETSFYYDLPQGETVQVTVYSLIGEKIVTLVNGKQVAGRHEVTWSGRDQLGNQVPSGIYFLVMDADAYHQVRKMTLIR